METVKPGQLRLLSRLETGIVTAYLAALSAGVQCPMFRNFLHLDIILTAHLLSRFAGQLSDSHLPKGKFNRV
jgi:hypothetical protein